MSAHAHTVDTTHRSTSAVASSLVPEPTQGPQALRSWHPGRSRHKSWERTASKLFGKHGATLHAFARALTDDSSQADALVLDAITTQVVSADLGADRSRPTTRELIIAVYTAWSCQPSAPTTTRPRDFEPSLSRTLSSLNRLPDDHRAALALCAFGDQTPTQVATILGIQPPRVLRLLREALLALGRATATGVAS